jgi:glycosyltransferase involved in cell wall biosynthesis
MATFQGMPFIMSQLESILVQLTPDDEVVISDNGSTDGTLAYLLDLAAQDQRVRVFSFDEIKGVIPNFQHALEKCRGDLIFLCDQDDIWKTNKMDTISRLFSANERLLAVQHDAELIDATGRVTDPSFFALRRSGCGVWKNYVKNTWQGCNMAFRREVLDIALPFPRSIPMHDVWIGLLSELSGDVYFLPQVLSGYRRHTDNVSAMKRASVWKIVRWRLCLAGAMLRKAPKIIRLRKLLKHPIL